MAWKRQNMEKDVEKDLKKGMEKDSNTEKNGKGLEMYVYECERKHCSTAVLQH